MEKFAFMHVGSKVNLECAFQAGDWPRHCIGSRPITGVVRIIGNAEFALYHDHNPSKYARWSELPPRLICKPIGSLGDARRLLVAPNGGYHCVARQWQRQLGARHFLHSQIPTPRQPPFRLLCALRHGEMGEMPVAMQMRSRADPGCSASHCARHALPASSLLPTPTAMYIRP